MWPSWVQCCGNAAVIAALAFALGCTPGADDGTTLTSGVYDPPTLWDGETADFRGIWQSDTTGYVNIEGHSGTGELTPAKSLIVDPPDGRIPYLSTAIGERQENLSARADRDPVLQCYQAGVPRTTYLPMPLQIVQSPGNFAIVYQYAHSYRLFYPESRAHMDGIDQWLGDTRSRWEGNTLVTDVVALVDGLWLDEAGNYLGTDARVTERYTRTGPDTLQYEATIEDPSVYTQPWTLRINLHRVTEPGARIIEDECLEDENGIRQQISPRDPRNLLRNNYERWNIVDALSNDEA